MIIQKICTICKNTFTWNEFAGGHSNKKYCSDRCRQKAYRIGEKGKTYTKIYNQRYKKPNVEIICAVCQKIFSSARINRYICDNALCKQKGKLIAKSKMWNKNPNIKAAYRYIDSLRKKIDRGTLPQPLCFFCGSSNNIQYHHPNYDLPYNVIPLCNSHHKEAHKPSKLLKNTAYISAKCDL